MSSMSPLRDINNGDPVDATDPQYNFQTIENFIDSDVVTKDGAKGFTAAVSGVAGTDPSHLATLAQIGTAVPVGTVAMFAGSTVPPEWAWCRGAAVSQTDPDYVGLFSVIGVTFGDPGSGNFNLPDFRDRSPMGSGGGIVALAATAGETDWELLTHEHAINHGHADSFSIASSSHNHPINHDHPSATTSSNGNHVHPYEDRYNALASGSSGFPMRSNNSGTPDASRTTWEAGNHAHTFNVPNFTGTSGSHSHAHTLNGAVTSHSGSSGSAGSSAVTSNRNIHPVLGINFIIKL